MDQNEFVKHLEEKPTPVVLDLWAPWCTPCRAMEPAFKQIQAKYDGQVDVCKINTDESPDVARYLQVMGIPTVIGFAGGKEILRRTGIQSVQALDTIFDATLHQKKPAKLSLAPVDRFLRLVAGTGVIIFGWMNGHSIWTIWIISAGAILLFSAVYDRCPIWKAVSSRIKALFQKSGLSDPQ
jgi:thioredoxin